MQLENLETGESIPLSQELYRGSILPEVDRTRSRGSMAGCGATARGVDLVINKFGARGVLAPACATRWPDRRRRRTPPLR